MCPGPNQARLAAFLKDLPRPRQSDERIHLVLAGDVVDFLAEREFEAFTGDEDAALAKLQAIVERTQEVWNALRGFAADGGYLTIMLGNHDIEMCLPAVRSWLLDQFDPSRTRFIYDNEAFTLGPVLIEHGNRYDGWNAVPYGALRKVRSRLSRRMKVADFPAMPGSQMVIDVINDLKRDYSWVDLLKPEDAGVLPILAAIGAGGLGKAWKAFKQFRRMQGVRYDDSGEPVDETLIAAEDYGEIVEPADQELWRLAQDVAAGGDATKIGAVDFLRGARDAVSQTVRQARRTALFTVLRKLGKKHVLQFDVGVERDTYLNSATNAVARGFEVVIYGHTHLAKNIPVVTASGRRGMYLNSGTWADLMRVPKTVFDEDDTAARAELENFVEDLENDEVSRWRRMAPTFVRIDLDGDRVRNAGLHFADENGSEPVTTDGLLERLSLER